jgi:hypothetical protein
LHKEATMRPYHTFVDFIDPDQLVQEELLQHPEYLESIVVQPLEGSLAALSLNPSEAARDILATDPDWINWLRLSRNPAPWVRSVLLRNKDRIDWHRLALNPAAWVPSVFDACGRSPRSWLMVANSGEWAGRYMKKNPSESDCDRTWLSRNTSEWAHTFMTRNPSRISWLYLLTNPAPWVEEAVRVSGAEIRGDWLSKNPAEWARDTLHNSRCVNVEMLCSNPSRWAMDLLRTADRACFDWFALSSNPAIFTYDYARMRTAATAFREELLRHVMHPRNALRLQGLGLVVTTFYL